jgi:hypothetical protein
VAQIPCQTVSGPNGWVLTFDRISKYKSGNMIAPMDVKYMDKITDPSTQTFPD